ncbi:glucan biosynthesis protein G [Shewanella xiamenensis]|uniref:Glucans biosynthesis protein G n=1 Tax=Shewanella xiamenensis TaxID=332186 RepID=A0AAE4TN70_9GAMM|nr:glucan biosynthesis protein G [Shewanella xiamenensis]MDV5390054.1 glucan biosynthesis protein G [Shewanella xiamenensis]
MVSLLRCQSFKPSSLICSLALSAAFAFSGTAFADETKPVENKPTTPVVSPPNATAQPANKTQVRFTKTGTFDGETVVKLARKLASKPYVVLKDPLPAGLAKLTYDEYRDIRFNPVSSIWRDQGLPFQMQMFHRGFYFQDLIEIAIVEANQATHLAYEPKYFTAGEVISQALPNDDIGYSGFRIHNQLNTNGIFDELMVFQGASYFRALGKGNSYGLSARGLALKTADPEGEEFPIFRAFWVERPSYDSNLIVVHALLDSPSVAGAYRFSVRPGDNTQIDVEATLFPRVELNKVGLAPSTSMFLHSLNGRHDTDDFRPEVHDSDGLLMFNGRGEHLWRPLANPRQLQVSAFSDNSPQGFGLIQRERNYASYQDLEAQYERRPSLWIEPVGNWGQGAVVLTEIPTESEIHDNIVSFWKPRQPIPAGSEYHFAYRMSWGDEPVAKTNSVVVSRTASGRADIAKATPRRLFVVDYHLNGAMPDELPLAKVESSGGVISNVVIARNAANNGYRLAFELEPEDKDLIELRAELKFSTPRQVETWLYRWTL